MTPRIFVSYRRDDAAGDAGRLADHLHRRFGAAHVFLDIHTIAPGADFVRALQESLRQTAAVLVVIGPRWLSLTGADGRRRLDDPRDFVRLEVETALSRDIPVVPVLVQGARLPREDDLPPSLAGLATRQAVTLDHAEFHDDAERLCGSLAPLVEAGRPAPRRWWAAGAAAAAALVVAGVGYWMVRSDPSPGTPASVSAPAAAGGRGTGVDPAVNALLQEASAQRRREQYAQALATLAHARESAPASGAVQQLQQDVAMDWIRSARVETGTSTFAEAIAPALAVVDTALPAASGPQRADLLAHSGWAAFLMWRDGNRRLDPADWYEEALAVEPQNPYANAMLAHWVLFQDDDVARAATLFETALRAGRATEAVRRLQWAGYGNARTPEAEIELVRLADAMRRRGETPTAAQSQALWNQYYFAMPAGRARERQLLLGAIPPDAHLSTLQWAFDDYAAGDESRRQTVRYYAALLHARAGRGPRGVTELRMLQQELAGRPGSLQDAVAAALRQLTSGRGRAGS